MFSCRIVVGMYGIRGRVRGVSWSEFIMNVDGRWMYLVWCRAEDGFWSQRALVARYAAKGGRRETNVR